MSSEREIRKRYVNGRTICIAFFFYLFQILDSAGRVAATEGDNLGGGYPSSSVLAGRKPAKIAEYVHVCIAC